MKIKLFIIFVSLFFITACTNQETKGLINKEQAISLMDKGAILIDVRTENEYLENHIEGAISLPLNDLDSIMETYDENQVIIVYCQSGNRSHIAKGKLEEINYKNVYDFGSIENWGD